MEKKDLGGGVLTGLRVIEVRGLGPAPFCGMLLSDMGAEVIRVDRSDFDRGGDGPYREDINGRNKRSIAIDFKSPDGHAAMMALIASADALIDPFRPGVMERLGLGPDPCLAANPRLVYGRMTGWGQDGPLAMTAGHDLNYIALTGTLYSIGRPDSRPVPPLNLIGDFAGGALYLALGILGAVIERQSSGRGQVIDAAMIDGATHLMTSFYGYLANGRWTAERGVNFLDGGAPYYDTYETSDGKFVSVAPVEPKFYAEFLDLLGLDASTLPDRDDRANWPALKARFQEVFATRTRDAWAEIFDGSDACFAPVLDLAEAQTHPHQVARGAFVAVGDRRQPAPCPRFDRTPSTVRHPAPAPGADSRAILSACGLQDDRIDAMIASGGVRQT